MASSQYSLRSYVRHAIIPSDAAAAAVTGLQSHPPLHPRHAMTLGYKRLLHDALFHPQAVYLAVHVSESYSYYWCSLRYTTCFFLVIVVSTGTALRGMRHAALLTSVRALPHKSWKFCSHSFDFFLCILTLRRYDSHVRMSYRNVDVLEVPGFCKPFYR